MRLGKWEINPIFQFATEERLHFWDIAELEGVCLSLKMVRISALLTLSGCLCFGGMDNFDSPILDPVKWGYLGSPFSDAFEKGSYDITFKSNTDLFPQFGFIYWKEKISLNSNWSTHVTTNINPSFITGDGNGDYGNVQTAIGIIDDITTINNQYFNTYLRENFPNNPFQNNFYFNPNWTTNGNPESEIRVPVTSSRTLLEISYNAQNQKALSSMYSLDSSGGTSLLQSHEYDMSQWSALDGVYILVGGMSYNTITQSGTASIDNFEIVPEPSALSLLAVGLGGLAMIRRRRL
jgi:hypothetical protein